VVSDTPQRQTALHLFVPGRCAEQLAHRFHENI
jgi:hypothetical protein